MLCIRISLHFIIFGPDFTAAAETALVKGAKLRAAIWYYYAAILDIAFGIILMYYIGQRSKQDDQNHEIENNNSSNYESIKTEEDNYVFQVVPTK